MVACVSSNQCLSKPLEYGVSTFSYTCELAPRSGLDGTQLVQTRTLESQMSETALFGKFKDPELIVLKFRGQLQCRMDRKR